jgi:aspartyl-tRNA(Asn)/glutamyl-tRNA(Gln) amidotransferase subunit B
MNYQPIIGLEIHIELKTNSKMFCSCKNDPDEKHPSTNVCPVCMGHPGTLPVINKEAVRKVIKTGLALDCKIPEDSKFDRKKNSNNQSSFRRGHWSPRSPKRWKIFFS